MLNIVEAEGISKTFGKKPVLTGVSVKVGEGEIFGFLGPTGAGKTTLIKILTGQFDCEAGSAKIFNTDCNKISSSLYSKIGILTDNAGLYYRLSCFDNLMLFARIHNLSKQSVYDILERVKLADSTKKTVLKFSKGMLQRLLLARAVLHKPKLLFLDEPTNGLDPSTASEIHNLLFELRGEGTTIFLTTHNMTEATKMCDNVALLNDGVIMEYGNPHDICRKYNNENKITVTLKDNSVVTFQNGSKDADLIADYFRNNNVLTIHSSEPTLETVFIAVTGRGLV